MPSLPSLLGTERGKDTWHINTTKAWCTAKPSTPPPGAIKAVANVPDSTVLVVELCTCGSAWMKRCVKTCGFVETNKIKAQLRGGVNKMFHADSVCIYYTLIFPVLYFLGYHAFGVCSSVDVFLFVKTTHSCPKGPCPFNFNLAGQSFMERT